MMKTILLLDASVRKEGTTHSFCKSLKRLGEGKGCSVQVIKLLDYFEGKATFDELKELIKKSDLVGIINACYVNTLSYPSIYCLEKLVELYQGEWKNKPIFAITQGGMPYLDVHEPGIKACQFFAKETSMAWCGGLIFGLGPMINGKCLEETGRRGTKIVDVLDQMLEQLLAGNQISKALQKKITITIPKIINPLMVLFLNHQIKKDRKAHGIIGFGESPYL